jgi:hypothetical protein
LALGARPTESNWANHRLGCEIAPTCSDIAYPSNSVATEAIARFVYRISDLCRTERFGTDSALGQTRGFPSVQLRNGLTNRLQSAAVIPPRTPNGSPMGNPFNGCVRCEGVEDGISQEPENISMSVFFWMWVPLGLFAMIGGITTTWIRAKHGYPLTDSMGRRSDRAGFAREEIARHVDSALAERDAAIAKLEQRVRVLERIATDEPSRLSAEIDRLRDHG